MTTPEGAKSKTPKTKAIVLAVTLIVIATFAPALVVAALGWTSVLSVAMFAGLAASMATMMGRGWTTGLRLAVPFAVFSALVVWSAPYALVAAVVMAAAAFLRGYAAKDGLHNALSVTVIALGFLVSEPPHPEVNLAVPIFVGLVVLGSVLWVALVAFMSRTRVQLPPLAPTPRSRSLGYGIVLALLVGVATWFAVILNLGHAGGWMILTIVVVFEPYLQDGVRKGFERAGGTFLGFIIAILISLVIKDAALLYVMGTALMIAAVVLTLTKRPYWLYATVITPAVVLVDGAGSSIVQTAEVRLEATLIAVIVTMAVMLALTPAVRRLAQAGGLERY